MGINGQEDSNTEEEQETELSLPESEGFTLRKKAFVVTAVCCMAAIAAYIAFHLLPQGAGSYMKKADLLLKEKRYSEAISYYELALKKNPRLAKALMNQGFALDSLGEPGKAIESLDKALAINPRLARAWAYKGNALFSRGDLEQALSCYNESLRLDSRYAGAWANKASVLRKLKRYDEAREAFQKYISMQKKELRFDVTPSLVEEAASGVIPLIEEVTGLKFRKNVEFRFVTPEEMGKVANRRILRQMKRIYPEANPKHLESQALAFSEFYAEIIPEMYEFAEGALYVVPDNFQRNIILLKPGREQIKNLLTLLLVHDLVHALDDQQYAAGRRIMNIKDQEELGAFESILEGHAIFVTRQVSRKLGIKEEDFLLASRLSGGELGEASPFEQQAAQYVSTQFRQVYLCGEKFVRFVFEKEGQRGISRLFSAPPRSKSVILEPQAYYKKVLLAQEDYINLLSVIEKVLPEPGDWKKRAGRMDEMVLRSGFSVGLSTKEIEEALSGFKEGFVVSYIKGEAALVSMVLFRFGNDGNAVYFLNAEDKSMKSKWERIKATPGVAVSVLQDKRVSISPSDRAIIKEAVFAPNPTQRTYNFIVIAAYRNFLLELSFVNYKIENQQAFDLISGLFKSLDAKLKGMTG